MKTSGGPSDKLSDTLPARARPISCLGDRERFQRSHATRQTRTAAWPMRARIQISGGSLSGQAIEVDQAKLLIGREEDCHLRPDSEFISRHHCALLLDDYTLRIRDLGSKNGTFVNGRRIGAGDTILLQDDVVAVGEMTFMIDFNQSREPHPPASPPSPAIEGTGVYEGDTEQADARVLPALAPPPEQQREH
jgi:predicted component of type VI protein secretion system